MNLIEKQLVNYFLFVLLLIFTLHFRSTSEPKSVKEERAYSAHLEVSESLPKPRLKFRNIPGLNSNQVSTICQDKYGFIWIGTLNGLHRYDGSTMRLFLNDPKDSTSLVFDRIDKVYEDSDGNLWVGTSGGVCRYNRDYDNFDRFRALCGFVPENSPHPHRVLDFKEDRHGTLWIISNREGLLYYDEDLDDFISFFDERDIPGLTSFHFSAFEIDKAGNFWIGTFDQGLNIVNPDTREIRQIQARGKLSQILDDRINDIMCDQFNRVWIGTESGGVSKLELNEGVVASNMFMHDPKNPYSLRNNEIQNIYEDSKGRIWVCNVNGGLHLYDSLRNGFHNYSADLRNRHSLSSNSIWTIFEDKDERLWVGSGLTGVDVWDDDYAKFEHYYVSPDTDNGLKSNVIRAFAQDDAGQIWLATDGGGLSLMNASEGTFKTFQQNDFDKNSLTTNAVLSITKGPKGKLWLGTWAGGVNIYDLSSGKISLFDMPGSEKLKNVFHVIKDHQDNLWFATYSGGLNMLDTKTGELLNFMHDPEVNTSIGSDLMYTLYEDSEGDIYVGVRNRGLNILKRSNVQAGIFERYEVDEADSLSLPSNTVNQVLEDSQGNLWIGTTKGLCQFDRASKKFRRIDPGTGLDKKDIRAIIEDDNKSLWVRTLDGLTQILLESGSVKDYGGSEGVQKGSFVRHTMFKTSEGAILFAGEKGFNMFHPDSLLKKSAEPEVYFTDFKLFNKSVAIGGEDPILEKHVSEASQVVLGPRDLRFTFEFVGINFTRAENNQYAYKMVGLEEDWNYVEHVKSATYNNLSPGTYEFKVKAANHDGQWNEEGASIAVIVMPDWYETWWARVFLVGLGIYLLLLVVRWRTERFKLAKKQLELVVARRTLQLTEKNAEIIKQAEELQQKNQELGILNSSISQQAEELKTYNEALNTMNENLEDLVLKRTENLEKKNEELIRYSFTNAHTVRGPLTRILGLINLIKADKRSNSVDWIRKIEEATIEMDKITRSISKKLDSQLKEENRD